MTVVLGTAGHIDHGKTTLIKALTGIDCDRLEEEKKRGITIELGFAWLNNPDGSRLGIVDVPGHERFVKNMVAGAAGVDLVMLIIAADEGVMPQTREHLEICSLLGIQHGCIALTKIDMVDESWIELVKEDIKATLSGTFLENAPLFPVSSLKGIGLEPLRQYLISTADSIQNKRQSDIFRLPIDRVFTIKGHGTVVTGTVISGQVAVNDEVMIMPSAKLTKVRSLQYHGESVNSMQSGQRCAVNLQGLEVEDLERGQIVTYPNNLFASKKWLVHLECLKSAHTLKQRIEVHVHHGTYESLAKVRFLGQDKLEPGKSSLAELYFPEAICGIFGDRLVLRSDSPLRTIAGAVLVAPIMPNLRGKANKEEKMPHLEQLAKLAKLNSSPLNSSQAVEKTVEKSTEKDTARETAEELILAVLAISDPYGIDLAHLRVMTNLSKANLNKSLQNLASKNTIVCWDKDNGFWCLTKALEKALTDCLERATFCHAKEPLKNALKQGEICSGWVRGLPSRFVNKVIDIALKRSLLIKEKDGLRLASHKVTLANQDQDLSKKILAEHQKAGLTPPNFKEVLEKLNISEKEAAPLLRHLCEEAQLIKIKEGLYYSNDAFNSILAQVKDWFKNHDNLDIADLKTILGLSRKYLIAIIEYLDNQKITVRIGDKRQLR